MRRFAAVVFDLDDTLYLERDYVRSGFAAVSVWLAKQPGWCETSAASFGRACWLHFNRGQRGNIFDRAFESLGRVPEPLTVAQMVDCYRDHTPRITLADDVLPLVGRLAVAGVALGVITDGHRHSQWAKLHALGLVNLINEIVVTDDWGREYWKPNPRAFRHLEQCFGIHRGDCVYVGDNPAKDFLGARRCGWATVRIQRPGGLHCHEPPAPGAGADFQFRSLSEWEAACWHACRSGTASCSVDSRGIRVK